MLTFTSKYLRDALVITRMRKKILVAEHARCLFKLSKALKRVPGGEVEGRQIREEAEHLLLLRDPACTASGFESTNDSLVITNWR